MRYDKPQYRLELLAAISKFFQNQRRIRFVCFDNILRILHNFFQIAIISFIIIRVSFLYMLYAFIRNDNLVCNNIRGDALINLFVYLTN